MHRVAFGDLDSNPAQPVGIVVAANDFFTHVGRPTFGAADPGRAFAYWNCGGTTSNLGGGTPGSIGTPRLRFEGPLVGGFSTELRLALGKPSSIAAMAIHGGPPAPISFHGGLLSAFPIHVLMHVPTSGAGSFTIPSQFPPGLSNQTFVLQCLFGDPAGFGGVSLSNAVQLKTAM